MQSNENEKVAVESCIAWDGDNRNTVVTAVKPR